MVLYSVLAMVFAFVTWGQEVDPEEGPDDDPPELILHGLGHIVFGAVAVWAVRRPAIIITGGLLAVGLDADHIPSFLGAPTLDRAGHSAAFMLLSSAVMAVAAARGWLGPVSPILAAAMATAAVMSHIGFDALIGLGHMPLWAPFSPDKIVYGPLAGLAWQAGAVLLVTLAVVADRKWKSSPAHYEPRD